MKNRHWLMTGICILGMGAVLALALPSVRAGLGGLGSGSWIWLMALLCPLSHVFMMRGMHHGQGDASCHSEHRAEGDSSMQPATESDQA